MTESQRLLGLIASPHATFKDVNERPSWILPFCLILFATLLLNFIVLRVVVTDSNLPQIAQEKIHWDAQEFHTQLTPQEIQQQLTAIAAARRYWYVSPIVGVVISIAGLTCIFYLVLRVVRAKTTWVKILSVICWSFVVYRVLGAFPTMLSLLAHGSAGFHPAPPEAWSPVSFAHLVSRTAVSANVYSAVSKLDPFFLWALVLMVIGFRRTSTNMSLKKSAATIIVVEAVYLALNSSGLLPGAS